MNTTLCLVLAILSIFDYPARQTQHERLRRQFVLAVREGDTQLMIDTCQKGTKLLPDDPTWRYNLACALAYNKDVKPALDALEEAIDLGFRDVEAIRRDQDLKRVSKNPRFAELVEYAEQMRGKPLLTGPTVSVPATGVFGKSIALGEQNFSWNFDYGCFDVALRLAMASAGGNTGDLYMNRDGGHSQLAVAKFPGLTTIRLDQMGRDREIDLNLPNMLFPYPVFGNCSRAYVSGSFWRSISRAALSTELSRLKVLAKLYMSNQVWVFPSNHDTPPVGTNGDVFASITPYCITTAGRSYSDLPYLEWALEVSRSFPAETKRELVRRNLLAPTIITLLRQSFHTVSNETDYLSPKAHPTAFPPRGVDVARLTKAAAALKPAAIPPLVSLRVTTPEVPVPGVLPECIYATVCAWSYVLRSDLETRTFVLQAQGAREFAFVQTHGTGVDVKIERLTADRARVTVNRRGMSPTNRVDIAVLGRNPGTGWGAPSYLSLARMDAHAPYSDPFLTRADEPAAK